MTEPSSNSNAEKKNSKLKDLFINLFITKKLFWVLTLLILVADLWTKEIAISFVQNKKENHEISQVFWVSGEWLGLVEVYNKGGPWGIGSDKPSLLKYSRILALLIIIYMAASTPAKQKLQILALGLVMGGAIGNIWDSCAIGMVRDFILVDLDFPPADPWPAFNLADSAICVGVFFLALGMLVTAVTSKKAKEKPAV